MSLGIELPFTHKHDSFCNLPFFKEEKKMVLKKFYNASIAKDPKNDVKDLFLIFFNGKEILFSIKFHILKCAFFSLKF